MESWREIGTLDGWNDGAPEYLQVGMMGSWNKGRLGQWKAGTMENIKWEKRKSGKWEIPKFPNLPAIHS